VLRYRAPLDQFPVFGREGYALPLGRAVQHTGEIDGERPLEQLWVFGTPAAPLDLPQVRLAIGAGGAPALAVSHGVQVEFFGDALPVGTL
jgi:hypothetical protein